MTVILGGWVCEFYHLWGVRLSFTDKYRAPQRRFSTDCTIFWSRTLLLVHPVAVVHSSKRCHYIR